MIFIQLSQSWHVNPLNTVPLITWYQDAAFRFVIYRTNERKNFWFVQESWAAAELTSPRHARAALGAAAGLLTSATPSLATRNRGTKRRLIRLRPTKGLLSCGATTDVGGPGQFRGLSFGGTAIPFGHQGERTCSRDCQDFCVRRFPSCAHEALFEHDGELRLRLGPLSRRSFPIRNGVVQNQI